MLPGMSLEAVGNGGPRGMSAAARWGNPKAAQNPAYRSSPSARGPASRLFQSSVTGPRSLGDTLVRYTNDQPSYGGQWSYKATPRLTLTQTLYAGPDQTTTSMEFWRVYGNHIVEWKGEDLTLALSYDIGTEAVANRPGHPRAFVTGANVVARWHVSGPWAVAVRPELYWDRNGRWTGHEQFVKAMTTTLEYKAPYGWTNTTVRLEHRWDESTGAGGGFFRHGEAQPGVPSLTPNQHLLLLGILWTFDSP